MTVILTLMPLLATIALAPPAPKQGADVNEGFVRVKLDPMQLARQADAAVLKLRDAEGDVATIVNIPEGKGINKSIVRVRDYRHVRVDYAVVRPDLSGMYTERFLRNGNATKWILGKNVRPTVMRDAKAQWPAQYPAFILRGMIDGSSPIYTYVWAAQRDRQNYEVWTEQRAVTIKGKTYRSQRVVVQRKGAALKSLGKARAAIAFEPASHLPISAISAFTPPGKKESTVEWHSYWHGPLKFKDIEFIKPKDGK